jgi:hypothetical protein
MSDFNAAEYKKKVLSSPSINECEKIRVPEFKKDQRYIFISYSHKDYKQVYCDLADLYESDIPFWYDEWLIAGVNWDEVVRQRMNDPRCAGVIFYMSTNLFLSQSIQTEIRIVLGEDGEHDFTPRRLDYFSVNLTELSPSDIIDSVYGKKKFTDVEDKMTAKSQWSGTLAKAFPDKALALLLFSLYLKPGRY